MILWYKELYLDKWAAKKPKKRKKKILSRRPLKKHCYLIALASNEKNVFEIFHTRELYFKYNQERMIYVVGIAKTEEKAQELLQTMVQDMLEKQERFLPRSFFDRRDFSAK